MATWCTSPIHAARRDFTINALIFDVKNQTIVDYAGGFEDIQDRVVRVIGNPEISFPEDPVRMYRAVKFAALLGLSQARGGARRLGA